MGGGGETLSNKFGKVEKYPRTKTSIGRKEMLHNLYIWRKAHILENLEEYVISITGEDNSSRTHCHMTCFIRVFALF